MCVYDARDSGKDVFYGTFVKVKGGDGTLA
jgi:hypothetical protein